MKKRGKKFMIAAIVALILIGVPILFFRIPFSPLEREFLADRDMLIQNDEAVQSCPFTESDLVNLPAPVQKHFRVCGFLGKPKMSRMKAEFADVPFRQGKEGPALTIDYTQYNFVGKPARIALIRSSMYGIPFDGYDSFQGGTGSMRGVVGKLVTIFSHTGTEMDQAALATFLAESLLVPNAALQDYITWEGIDETHARAVITYGDISAQGIFTFGETGEMLSFTTDDRALYQTDGTVEHVRWSAVCGDYREQDGYCLPTALQAVWHYSDGDLVYFDGKNVRIEYD